MVGVVCVGAVCSIYAYIVHTCKPCGVYTCESGDSHIMTKLKGLNYESSIKRK